MTNIFQEFNRDVNIGEFVGYVYEDVCLHCPSRDLCFYQDGGISRLGKLINKGFKYNFNNEDNEYIKHNCINPQKLLMQLMNIGKVMKRLNELIKKIFI